MSSSPLPRRLPSVLLTAALLLLPAATAGWAAGGDPAGGDPLVGNPPGGDPGGGDPLVGNPAEVGLPPMTLPGLEKTVRVRRDGNHVPHIFAQSENDAVYMLGWLHAQDRFFQMDLLRRTFSGTLAELVGDAALAQDIELRTLGLRRGAAESLPQLTADSRAWLTAYADGVNAYLADPANPLPPEYGALELTREGIDPWGPVDSLVITKGLAFGLSFDLSDIDNTEALLTYIGVGLFAGFDGQALFSEDLYRSAPFDPAVSIPSFLETAGIAEAAPGTKALGQGELPSYLGDGTRRLLADYRQRAAAVPLLERALDKRNSQQGSNWWISSGLVTDTGNPILANDPHLSLDTPSVFYEVHMRVRRNGDPPLSVIGVSFPGTPAVVLGCNGFICWGATTNPMDVTDVYQEALVLDGGVPVATQFRGELEPVTLIPQTFFFNQVGDGMANNLADANIDPMSGGLTVLVPRRNNGPVVAIDASDPAQVLGISVQYTGWRATREIDALRSWARALDLDDFIDGLQYFDVGSQNWAYADIAGNIAYFTSAEMPIREDLQLLNAPDGGLPPFFIRDGTGQLLHEWLPVANPQPNQSLDFEILPFAEMPQVINPAAGYVTNANNDPVGTTLDNNPLNQLRPGGGLYYLSPGYATGFRAGRIQRLFDSALGGGGTLTQAEIEAFQANNQLLDAEALLPYLLAAFANAGAGDAPPALAALAADPDIGEAIGRLSLWDFSTPTGIPEGYDPGDDPENLPQPSQDEIDASVAATLYSVWRGQAVRNTIDATLAGIGLDGLAPGSSLAMSALRNLLDSFPQNQGVGASGVQFFNAPGIADPADARDAVLLASLRDALDLLAGDDFAAAFGNSTDQGDYRWGRLHRIVFDHPLGGPFDVPPAGGLDDLAMGLPGLSRSGGFGAVDASSHSARADSENDFMFGSGPARRFVGEMEPGGSRSKEVIPGGQSGVLGSPFQADQLRLWLTNQYHDLHRLPGDVVRESQTFQLFRPARP